MRDIKSKRRRYTATPEMALYARSIAATNDAEMSRLRRNLVRAVLEEPQQGMGVGVAGQVTDGEMGDMACVASHLSGRGHAQLSTASGPGGNPW